MIILSTEELKLAEGVLKQFFPRVHQGVEIQDSFKSVLLYAEKVYGCIFNINRGKPHNLQVIADQWPDFTVIICKPKVQGTKDREGDFNIYSIYSKSKDSLRNILDTPGVINKDRFTLLAGVDIRHLEAVQEFADQHGLPRRVQGMMNVLLLQDSKQLQFKESPAGLRFAPLSAAHAHLVNSTWKYGGDSNSYNSVLNYISHNPSLCVIEEGGTEPVSWLLVYQHAALGLLHTLPQHRRKGYATILCPSWPKPSWSADTPCIALWTRKMTLPTSFSRHWGSSIHRITGRCGSSSINESNRTVNHFKCHF